MLKSKSLSIKSLILCGVLAWTTFSCASSQKTETSPEVSTLLQKGSRIAKSLPMDGHQMIPTQVEEEMFTDPVKYFNNFKKALEEIIRTDSVYDIANKLFEEDSSLFYLVTLKEVTLNGENSIRYILHGFRHMPDYSELFMKTYGEPEPQLKAAFEQRKFTHSETFFDQFGKHIMGYFPLYGKDKQFVGVLVLDYLID